VLVVEVKPQLILLVGQVQVVLEHLLYGQPKL